MILQKNSFPNARETVYFYFLSSPNSEKGSSSDEGEDEEPEELPPEAP